MRTAARQGEPSDIEVKSLVVGAASSGVKIPKVTLRLMSERITTRELIARTVEQQVQDLTEARRLGAREAREALDRQYLTRREIEKQASEGRVSMPAAPRRGAPIDLGAEIEKAWRGFEAGVFRVLVDGRQAESLDGALLLRPATRITFVRLMPLAGG
jgi:hypothetical protein